MNKFKQLSLLLAFILVLASCTGNLTVNQILANKETRAAIMDSIAHDDKLSREMMTAMMNNNDSMHQHIGAMMEMMRENPGMMQTMMSNMMEASKGDSNMMMHLYENMMADKEMMERMHRRMTKKDTANMPVMKH